MEKGRPIEWTPEKKQNAIDEILHKITEGNSIRHILRDNESLPSRKTFLEWLAKDKDLSSQYARTCDVRADIIFDEMMDIADDGTNDYMTKQIGDGIEIQVLNTEHIQRSRLRIDTRKWILSKMNPKKYSDKIDLTSDGNEIKQAPTIINLGSGIKP
jgi:hypothetical protein